MTIHIFDMASNQEIGVLSDEQFRFLQEQLVTESDDDDDYYLNRATLDAFDAAGGDPSLMGLLRTALGSREDMDIRWQRDDVT